MAESSSVAITITPADEQKQPLASQNDAEKKAEETPPPPPAAVADVVKVGEYERLRAGVWRCRICGEIYLGERIPSECPFCGSHQEHLEAVTENSAHSMHAGEPLAKTDLQNVAKTLREEYYDVQLYRMLAGQYRPDTAFHGIFKRLSKIEKEHAELVVESSEQKLADPALKHPKISRQYSRGRLFNKALGREHTASAAYAEYSAATQNPRMKLVWHALSEVEHDHELLIRSMMAQLGIPEEK